MKKYHRILKIKNKKIRIIGGMACIISLLGFITGITIGIIGGNKYNIHLMKLGIRISIISAIFMGILHILYFRTPKKLKKMLYGE